MPWTPDRDKFDQQVLENLPALQRFAIRLSGNVDRGEELSQETLLRATRSWQSYGGRSQFRTWLYQIAVNVFRDGLRRRAAQQELPDGLIDLTSRGATAGAESEERGILVAKAVSSLPPRQREVIVLHTYEQLTVPEVAEALGITEVNVRAQLTYARKRLKELLAPYFDSIT